MKLNRTNKGMKINAMLVVIVMMAMMMMMMMMMMMVELASPLCVVNQAGCTACNGEPPNAWLAQLIIRSLQGHVLHAEVDSILQLVKPLFVPIALEIIAILVEQPQLLLAKLVKPTMAFMQARGLSAPVERQAP